MTVVWADLAARSRGLTGRILPPEELDVLAGAADLRSLGQRLDTRLRLGLSAPGDDPSVVEAAIGRRAAELVAILGRWAGGRRRRACLDAVFADEDRRSLRGIFRAMATGDRPGARIAGALPTPRLPAPALAELARQSRPAAVLTLLSLWSHPFGGALALGRPDRPAGRAGARGDAAEGQDGSPEPFDLFRLELRLARAWSATAVESARGGGSELRRWIGNRIDLENAASALVVASGRLVETRIEDLFLPGGGHLSSALFVRACRAGNAESARALLVGPLAGTPCGTALSRIAPPGHVAPGEAPAEPSVLAFERSAARAESEDLRRRALVEPLSAAPLLLFVSRLREETLGLRRLVWNAALATRSTPTSSLGAVP